MWQLRERAPVNNKKRKRDEVESNQNNEFSDKPIDELIEEEKQKWAQKKAVALTDKPAIEMRDQIEESYEDFFRLTIY